MWQTRIHQAWLTLKALPWENVIRFTLSIGVPLVVGAVTGWLEYGVVGLIGSLFVVNIANVDVHLKERLLSTVAGAVLITGCAQLGSTVAHLPGLIAIGVLILGTTAGWLHCSHVAIETIMRFAVLGFLFGALQLAAFGTELIPIDEKVIFIFLAGGLWTAMLLVIEHWLLRIEPSTSAPNLREGWKRIRLRQTAGLRFALCYGIVPTIALSGSFLLHLPRPFWVTATTLIVMKPDSRKTVQRTSQRIMGTLIGVLLVGAIVTMTDNPNVLVGFILLSAPLIAIGAARSYTLTCTAITVLVMVMIDLLTLKQGGDRNLLPTRFYATLIGCILTVVGTAITYPELWLHKRTTGS